MAKGNSPGAMESSIKDNLLIIESQVMEYIDGQMVAFMKDRLKMV